MVAHFMQKAIEEGIAKALQTMKYSALRSDQRKVVLEYMNGKDVFVSLPILAVASHSVTLYYLWLLTV